MLLKPSFLLLLTLLGFDLFSQDTSNLMRVNPFIGTAGHGHTYPGATAPFGMVQLSPDTDDTGWDWCSGYNYADSTIMGFSHTHLSGTGISDMADILIMPYIGKTRLLPGKKDGSEDGYRSKFSHKNETASPGYYSVILDKHGIKAELAASEFSGYHRYTFPASDSARIIIDLQHGLDRHRSWLTERVLDSELVVVDSVTLRGYRKSTGWANIQEVYFLIQLSKPMKNIGMSLHDVFREPCKIMRGRNVKGVLTFDTKAGEAIEMKVSISSLNNIECKPGEFFEFNMESKRIKSKWSTLVNQLSLKTSDSKKAALLTAIYHNYLSPNFIQDSELKLILTTYSNWDTYRAANSFKALTMSKEFMGIFMYDFIKHVPKQGYLPIWKLWNDEVHCMVGAPGIPILVENFIKTNIGLDTFITIKAIESTLSTDSPAAPWSLYDKYGYIPNDKGEMHAVSKTLEMAYAHGCAARFFKHVGITDKYSYHWQKAQAYRNLYDPSTGFFRGKDSQGKFTTPFDPTKTDEKDFVEATPWQYLFHVQHDIDGMIELFGGKKKTAQKLDELFTTDVGKIDDHILDITGLIGQYAHGNEPSHHVAYLYNYVDQPWKTTERIHQICNQFYSDKPDGLCGNEDCGQMSAWYIFSSLGFYPVDPSSAIYDLGIPMVEEAKFQKLVIKTKNYHPDYKYVKSVTFNGQRLSKPQITHAQITEGGTLIFELSPVPVEDCYRK